VKTDLYFIHDEVVSDVAVTYTIYRP